MWCGRNSLITKDKEAPAQALLTPGVSPSFFQHQAHGAAQCMNHVPFLYSLEEQGTQLGFPYGQLQRASSTPYRLLALSTVIPAPRPHLSKKQGFCPQHGLHSLLQAPFSYIRWLGDNHSPLADSWLCTSASVFTQTLLSFPDLQRAAALRISEKPP